MFGVGHVHSNTLMTAVGPGCVKTIYGYFRCRAQVLHLVFATRNRKRSGSRMHFLVFLGTNWFASEFSHSLARWQSLIVRLDCDQLLNISG